MQRQSLGGSPSSLSPSLNRDIDIDDDKKSAKSPSKPRLFSIPSSSYSPSSALPQPSPSSSTLPPQHKFIHGIPLLTLLCFLVLFFFSHDPSPSDLAQFKGFKLTTDTVADPGDLIDGGGNGAAVRSWRNLHASPKSRVNRKLADF